MADLSNDTKKNQTNRDKTTIWTSVRVGIHNSVFFKKWYSQKNPFAMSAKHPINFFKILYAMCAYNCCTS